MEISWTTIQSKSRCVTPSKYTASKLLRDASIYRNRYNDWRKPPFKLPCTSSRAQHTTSRSTTRTCSRLGPACGSTAGFKPNGSKRVYSTTWVRWSKTMTNSNCNPMSSMYGAATEDPAKPTTSRSGQQNEPDASRERRPATKVLPETKSRVTTRGSLLREVLVVRF